MAHFLHLEATHRRAGEGGPQGQADAGGEGATLGTLHIKHCIIRVPCTKSTAYNV